MLEIEAIELRRVSLPLVHPFETSFARETDKECLLVRVCSQGLEGWGEVVAMSAPLYNEETLKTCWHLFEDFLIPRTLASSWAHPRDWARAMQDLRRNYMARAGMEAALWDLFAQTQNQSLSQLWGGRRERIPVGVSLGIESHLEILLERVDEAVAEGYRRIKLKIKPGWDVVPVEAVRQRYPELLLQVDANSAYRLEDADQLCRLDAFELLLIEQPLAHDDLHDHALLARQLKTPLCLDESIEHLDHCRHALDTGAAQIINIKPGRVGGFSMAIDLHDYCAARGAPCWVGGMLETGIGRLQNLALASLANFTLPGDLSASRRYFAHDLIVPGVELLPGGEVEVPTSSGLGQRLDGDALHRASEYSQWFRR